MLLLCASFMKILLSFILFAGLLSSVVAQSVNTGSLGRNMQVHIAHSYTPVKVDGILDDSIWKHAEVAKDFFLKFPNDKDQVKLHTEARIAYDQNFIYVAFTSYDSGKNIIQSLKRDIGHIENDGVGIVLDPQNLHTNGFFFAVNALNAQSEDQVNNNQEAEPTWSWDSKWFSATKRNGNSWTAEMAIPFKTLRFPPGSTTWGVNFIRVDMVNNQYSVWSHVPVNFRIFNLGYTGTMVWDSVPPAPGKNIVLIPYLSGGLNSDKENGQSVKGTVSAGLDAKIAVSSSMNLDLTLNPDFSQVEVDQQVTNLTRYDIFLPEKRSFFLENSDIFGGYGIPEFITPFYSRTIGLDKNGNRIPIIGGARLSGNLDSKTRIGVMNMQTAEKGDFAAQNYSAVSVNRNVFSRSVVKAYFLNRQGFLTDEQKKNNPLDAWGRNAGVSFDYLNHDAKWGAWAAYHTSMKPGISKDKLFGETGFSYNGATFSNTLDLATVGTNYYTDMGYVQRLENYDAARDTVIRVGFWHIYDNATLKFFPQKGMFNRHTISFENYIAFNPDNSFNEGDHTLQYDAQITNNSGLGATVESDEINLLYPISFTDGKPLPAAKYNHTQFTLDYYSDTRKLFSYMLSATAGSFYNGTIQTYGGTITFRHRPHLNIALQAEYNKLQFPDEYGSTEIISISPRVEINFNTKVSWTTYLQYNTQQNNFNINSRFQYRFKPMSDMYIVYTDNYYTSPLLKNKNRALVFKLTYWFNV